MCLISFSDLKTYIWCLGSVAITVSPLEYLRFAGFFMLNIQGMATR